jgi:hypothetical protein
MAAAQRSAALRRRVSPGSAVAVAALLPFRARVRRRAALIRALMPAAAVMRGRVVTALVKPERAATPLLFQRIGKPF